MSSVRFLYLTSSPALQEKNKYIKLTNKKTKKERMLIVDSLPSRLFISLVLLMLIAVNRASCVSADEANEARIQKESESGNKKAARVQWLNKNRTKFHASVHLVHLFAVSVLNAVFFTLPIFTPTEYTHLSPIVSVLICDLVILTFGIYIPGRMAKCTANQSSLYLSLFGKSATLLLTPLTFMLLGFSDLFLRLFRITPDSGDDEVTEEEILMMVDIGSSSGAIDPEEKEMINNIFEFDDTPAKDIMTHRTDVEFLWIEDGTDEWNKSISDTNHTVYPVCGESVDDILGVLSSKDFYKFLQSGDTSDVKSILKDPFFIPESLKADELLRQMQKNKNHFAFVLDEYGGLGGIITMSDLLEEIVGTLSNDSEENEEDIIKLDSNTWKISGSADIDTVSETLEIELPIEEYNTFAGMILAELGTIPDDGATPELEAFGLSIKVTKIAEHRIEETLVALIEPETKEDE